MTTIRVKENEPFDVALRRFKRTIEKLGTDSATPPPVGSIAVLWRRDANADSGKTADQIRQTGTSGHVSLLVEPFTPGSTSITLLGGNQGNRVSKVTYALGNDYGVLSFRSV